MAGPVDRMDRKKFLKQYKLKLDKEFELDGQPAEWTPGLDGPQFWGEQQETLEVHQGDPTQSRTPTQAIAFTADQEILAIATNAVIRIYHRHSKQQRAELGGNEHNFWRLQFAKGAHGEHILLSYSAVIGNGKGTIIKWSLDSNGRLHDSNRIMPFATKSLTDKALSAIEGDLRGHHDMTADEIGNVTRCMEDALIQANRQYHLGRLPHVEGILPGFGSEYVSHDGGSFLYEIHNDSTQNGMRPPGELPQIVVARTSNLKEVHRLAGHQDAIMWASFSPDDTTIGIASWDKHFSIWNAKTGATTHLIGPTTGQNWTGAFSPDSRYVLLSGGNTPMVATYEVDTGKEVAVLNTHGHRDWVREVAWSPDSVHIAVVLEEQTVVLWIPSMGVQYEVFKLQSDGSLLESYCRIAQVKWVDDGKKLVLRITDSTIFVWDLPTNRKWRFQRPFGTPEEKADGDMFWHSEMKAVMSLDGDGVVRVWWLRDTI